MERRGVRGAFCKLPRDSLSLVSVYGQAERAIFYITSEGKAGVEVYDKSGGRHYIVGNS